MAAPMDESKLFERLLDCENERVLTIKQSYIGDVGCVVWDAALVLSKYLETEHFKTRFGDMIGKKVIELGAGTGAVGLVAGINGASVIITDLSEFIPLMELNIKHNKEMLNGPVSAKMLKWGEDVCEFIDPHPDLILMSDCIYYMEALEDLVKTMDALSSTKTEILCCYEERTIGQNAAAQETFIKLVESIFNVREVPMSEQHTEYCSEDIHILSMVKR